MGEKILLNTLAQASALIQKDPHFDEAFVFSLRTLYPLISKYQRSHSPFQQNVGKSLSDNACTNFNDLDFGNK
jgi:hypothetical protein